MDQLLFARGDAFIREIFFFLIQASGNDGLPAKMLNKLLCAKALNLRAEQVGDRLSAIIHSRLWENFTASFDDWGPYIVVWDENDKAVQIRHVSGTVANIDDEGKFHTGFTKHMWHSDYEAYVKGQRLSRFTMHDYFLENEGPNATKLTPDTLIKLAEKAEATVVKIKEELSRDEVKVFCAIALWRVSVQ